MVSTSREKLIAAAKRCLVEKGHGACSVKDIAAEAGVNHGLVHHYFGSKEGLWVAMMQREAEIIQRAIEEVSEQDFVEGFYLPEILKNPNRIRAFIELLGLSMIYPRVREELKEIFRLRRQELGTRLNLQSPETSLLVFSAFFGMAVQSHLEPDLPVAPIAKRLLTLIRGASGDG